MILLPLSFLFALLIMMKKKAIASRKVRVRQRPPAALPPIISAVFRQRNKLYKLCYLLIPGKVIVPTPIHMDLINNYIRH